MTKRKRHVHDLPVGLLGPITNKETAERFLFELCRAGLDHHPDDDPLDCLRGTDLTDTAKRFVNERMIRAGALHDDCDVYEALMRAHRRVHGDDSIFNEED